MLEPSLTLEIFLNRKGLGRLARYLKDTILNLIKREDIGVESKLSDIDSEFTRMTPTSRTGREDLKIARTVKSKRLLHLVHDILRESDVRGRCIGTMGSDDERQRLMILHLTRDSFTGRSCSRGSILRSGARTLDTSVHVSLVVITDIEYLMAALKHARDGTKTDVKSATITAETDDIILITLTLGPESTLDARSDSSRVLESSMDPGDLPTGPRIRGRKDLKTAS